MNMKKELFRAAGTTAPFLLIAGIFGFVVVRRWPTGLAAEAAPAWSWASCGSSSFFVVACGAMWLKLRVFGKAANHQRDDPQS